MKRTQKVWHSIRLTLLIALTVIAGFQSEINAQQGKKAESLKVALLPILDAFPFYVAESEGYFVNYGVDVKAVPVASGLERDHRTDPILVSIWKRPAGQPLRLPAGQLIVSK